MLLVGVVYAAWDDVVSSGDQLTSASWNEVVERVKAFDVSSGNIGIGTSSPENAIHISRASTQAGIFQENTDGTQGGQYPSITQYAYNSGHAAIVGGRATGTKASPGVAPANVTLQTMVGRGYDGTDFQEVGRISVLSGENFSSSELDGKITFQVRDNNVANNAMTILENGNVGIGTTSPTAKLQIENVGGLFSAFGNLDLGYNLYFDGSDWRRIGNNSSAVLVELQTPGSQDFAIYNASDGVATADSIPTFSKIFSVRSDRTELFGDVTLKDLEGTYGGGSAYACINNAGVIYASETACP